jgi:hypothetical protein
MSIEFGNCSFDYGSRQLFRDGREVHLSPKAHDVLKVLIDRSPDVVGQKELLAEVWPGLHLEEGRVAGVIHEIRNAIGDDASRPQYLMTIHGTGYRFAGLATGGQKRSVRCWFELGREEFLLHEGVNVIGRDPGSDIFLKDDDGVSRRHAQVVVSGDRITLKDISKHGTFLQGKKIESAVALNDGDKITISRLRLKFRLVRSADQPHTQ